MYSGTFREVETLLFSGFDFQSGTDHPNPTWLQTCPMSMSSQGDLLALGLGQKVVVVSSSRQGGVSQKCFDRSSHLSDEHQITSLLCLPVADGNGHHHLVWTCCVVGYSSGLVEVLTADHGQPLLRRKFHDGPVMSLRSSATSYPQQQQQALLPSVGEVLIVYEHSLVSLAGPLLHRTLTLHRGRLAEATASRSGELPESLLDNFQARRLHVKDQILSDVAVVDHPNVAFDQLVELAASNRVNETHLRSLKTLSNIVTVGEDPFVQFNLPYNYRSQELNELAESVVSTVTSGIFRVASGLLWEDQKQKKKDPEQKLTLAHVFKDQQKIGSVVEKSFDSRYLAILDGQNRVVVMEAATGVIVNVWKGYHHAQIAWVNTSEMDGDGSGSSESADAKVACLLAIYLPRRGSLEVCSVERKVRIAEFSVSKAGRLIQCNNNILESTSGPSGPSSHSSSFAKTTDACFVDPDGTILKITVPIRSIIDQSSATSLDLASQHKFLDVLVDEKTSKVEDLLNLIAAAKSSATKINMLLDLARCDAIPLEDVKEILLKFNSQVPRVSRCVDSLRHAVEICEFVLEVSEEQRCQHAIPDDDSKFIEELTPDTAFADTLATLLDAMRLAEEEEEKVSSLYAAKKFSLPLLVKWLDLSSSSFEGERVRVPITTRAKEMVPILEAFCAGAARREQEFQRLLEQLALAPEPLMRFSIQTFFACRRVEVKRNFGNLQALLRVIISCGGNTGHVRSICHSASISAPLFFFLHQWNEFASSENFQADSTRSLKLVEAFLSMKIALRSLLHDRRATSVAESGTHTLETVFNAGNGRIAEILGSWLAQSSVTADSLHSAEVTQFLDKCSTYFPKNVRHRTISSHLAWEYFHQWNRRRSSGLHLLQTGCRLLEDLATKTSTAPAEAPFVHKLCQLVWKAFLDKVVRDSVNATEIRSASRCVREIGVDEDGLPGLMHVCAKVARILVDTDFGSVCGADEDGGVGGKNQDDAAQGCYDDISVAKHGHLLDQAMASCALRSSEQICLQYQFVVATCLILTFEEVAAVAKPLELFTQQEANGFFQGSSEGGSSSSFSSSFDRSHSLRGRRKRFLRLVCSSIVRSCIHRLPPSSGEDEGKLETDDYREWHRHVTMLGKMWFMSDVVKEELVVALYRDGFDVLGGDMLQLLSVTMGETRGSNVGKDLLRVAMLRLTKYVYESQDHGQKLITIKPVLLAQLSALQGEAASMGQTRLEATRTFLVQLCSLALGEEETQLACECLSLVQIFLREEEKKKGRKGAGK